jgi:hypothetical protein
MNGRVMALSTALLVSAGATAADPCKDDVQKLCQGVQPGGGRIIRCLDEHAEQVSAPCKDNMQERRFEDDSVRNSCGTDFQTLCPGIKAGGGRIMECLHDHEAQLSPACKEAIDAVLAHEGPCKEDAKKLCPGIAGGPQRQQCLRDHTDQLSPACKEHALGRHRGKGGGGIPPACQPDIGKVCKDASYGGQQMVIDCLRSYEDKISDPCKQALGLSK